ncbi:MAG: hypothetical protein MJ172_09650 [Clostridia bacterium]|nr:hypothetical protein [Clostridia bacterium]
MKKRKYLITALCCLTMASSWISVDALNNQFTYKLYNTDTSFNTYYSTSNTKAYASEPATIKTEYNNAPGAGFAFVLRHYNSGPYLVTGTNQVWISGRATTHPTYMSGHNVVNDQFYIAARIDNDYSGPYNTTGKYDSDYTNP